jgi:hypothetical protein
MPGAASIVGYLAISGQLSRTGIVLSNIWVWEMENPSAKQGQGIGTLERMVRSIQYCRPLKSAWLQNHHDDEAEELKKDLTAYDEFILGGALWLTN